MALTRTVSLRDGLRVAVFVALVAAVPLPAAVHAEDSRIEKAKKVRDDILARRRAAAVVPSGRAPAEEDPFQAAVTAARERLAAIDAQIEEKRRRSETLAAPREKLTARSDELNAKVAKIEEHNRARVEAIYRSAKLGAGAAGWHPEPARSARLSRYLAAIAARQQQSLEVVEVEQGSVIASLDLARAEDATAANEMRVLDADRMEAEASLERALADAGGTHAPTLTAEEAEAEALAHDLEQEQAIARGGPGDFERPVGNAESAMDSAESAIAVQRALALLEAKTGVKPSAPAPGGDEIASAKPGAAASSANADDFRWPAPVSPDSPANMAKSASNADAAKAAAAASTAVDAKAAADAKATADARATADAKLTADKAAADAKAEAEKKAAADAKMAAEAKAETDKKAAAARAAPGASDDEAPPELEDGPPVLASSQPAGDQVASLPSGQEGGEAAGNSDAAKAAGLDAAKAAGADAAKAPDQPKRPNLLSRFFGSDRESDSFASSRGTLPPPVAGKVVANYGQQHKSGATYRGVILRAGHSAPIKAVAGGKVSFAGNVPGLGNTVIVSHGGRYHTVYARLGEVEVKEGQSVTSGTELGELPADNADMHFELRDQGKAIDPVPWLKGGVPGAAP